MRLFSLRISFCLILLAFLFSSAQTFEHFSFVRKIDCTKLDVKNYCHSWAQTITLYQYSTYVYYCFPGDLFVLTKQGPKQMKDLKLQDQLFGMNLDTGKNQFNKLEAWLHHDSTSLFEYNKIEVQNSDWTFLGSGYHNIAFANQQQTDFKFLKDLTQNDSLISLTEDGTDFKVKSVSSSVQKQGMYSPFSSSGTFYIFPDNFDIDQYNSHKEYPMILVHSLSQIRNPRKNFDIAKSFLSVSGLVTDPYQPAQDQQHTNALIEYFRFLFGSDWVDVGGQKIFHRQSGITGTATVGTYSQTRNRRKEQRKRKAMIILAMQNVLSDTMF